MRAEVRKVALESTNKALGLRGLDINSPDAYDIAQDVAAVAVLNAECLLALEDHLVFGGQSALEDFAEICMNILRSGYCLTYDKNYAIYMYAETPKRHKD